MIRPIDLFQRQLSDPECKPCSGDYLRGRTPLEVIQEWERLPSVRAHRAELVQLLAKKIKDWRLHAGERQLYFLEHDPLNPETLNVTRVWETQVARLFDTHYVMVPVFLGSSALPRLEKKV